jgi:putative DNA-invertase from lambdoid prophage Rac
MARIAYYRTSTSEQSIESQRTTLGGPFDQEFKDEGVSGSTLAASRPNFSKLLSYIRSGDTLYVYAVDRLGRDAIDVQTTVRDLLAKGVSVHTHSLGPIDSGAGELILAVLAQVASMEKARINERTAAGRVTAQEHLKLYGLTHKGKRSMGRPLEGKPDEVKSWKLANMASLSQTATQFNLSLSTIKRYCHSN